MATNIWDEQGATNRPRREPLDYVDPLIGTAELGNTFPAVCLPFGLSKWTPQTAASRAFAGRTLSADRLCRTTVR